VPNVQSVLWKRLTESDFKVLNGIGPEAATGQGQKDIRLRGGFVDEFVRQVTPKPTRELAVSWEFDLPLAAFNGPSPAPVNTLTFSQQKPGGSRAGEWRITRQFKGTTYPLWSAGRGVAEDEAQFGAAHPYVLVIRTGDGVVHARVATIAEVKAFPAPLSERIQSLEKGMAYFDRPADPLVARVLKALRESTNVLLYGPTGTGKTWLMTEVRRMFLAGATGHAAIAFAPDKEHGYFAPGEQADWSQLVPAPKRNCRQDRWVTFHQSYSYEQFVVGLVPTSTEKAPLTLETRVGPLLQLAEHARAGDGASLMLIDEINRGNVSRVLGEFVTLLEADKRLEDDGKATDTTVQVQLPYVSGKVTFRIDRGSCGEADATLTNPFTMPRHVYSLASMNSVDRTTAPLDAALRRRFHVVAIEPDYDLLASHLGVDMLAPAPGVPSDPPGWFRLAIDLLKTINQGIRLMAGDDFVLGHAYLWHLNRHISSARDARDAVVDLWEHHVLPQLQELFRSEPDQLAGVLRAGDDPKRPSGYPYSRLALGEYAEVTDVVPVAISAFPWSADVDVAAALKFLARTDDKVEAADAAAVPEVAPPADAAAGPAN
jgi:hypothetical protein